MFLSIAVPASAISRTSEEENDVGNSRWSFSKDGIRGAVILNSFVFSQIKPIADGNYNLAAPSDEQLQQLATHIIQPYLDKKLSVTVNDKTCSLKVNKLVRASDGVYMIWLSADHVGFNKPENDVRIVYSLLFDETKDLHVNLAFGYVSDAPEEALQRVFDVSRPEFQIRFDSENTVWQFSIKRGASAATTAQESRQEVRSSN
jgi:hypothetical protein